MTFDPRHWNAGMDATVNTGLGAGARERDMRMIQIQRLPEKAAAVRKRYGDLCASGRAAL